MFTQTAARKTTSWLVQGGQVSEDDRVVYEFGLDKLFSSLANFAFAVILGLLLGMLWQTVVFYIAYIMLRVYAGGYHAEKPLTCFFASIGILIPCLMAIRFYQVWNEPVVFYGLLVASGLVLVGLAPVDHKNKMLNEVEKEVYNDRMMRNLAIVMLVAVVLATATINSFAIAVLSGILLSAITVCVGKMKSL